MGGHEGLAPLLLLFTLSDLVLPLQMSVRIVHLLLSGLSRIVVWDTRSFAQGAEGFFLNYKWAHCGH